MNIQFKKDSLELLILLIIRKSDQYGYSLIQLIKKKVEISEGTIYPLLRKMVNFNINHLMKGLHVSIIELHQVELFI